LNNNKNTSQVADGEGQKWGAMIPQERKERGLRGLEKLHDKEGDPIP
jgi:hypothetical protein